MTTEPQFAEQAPAEDTSVVRAITADLTALVRVLFGVGGLPPVSLVSGPSADAPPPRDQPPSLSVPAASATSPEPEPERRRAPAIPLSAPSPIQTPAPGPKANEPRPTAPPSLPFSDIPVADSLPGPATQSAPDGAAPLRRPGGPTPELLDELAFLDE